MPERRILGEVVRGAGASIAIGGLLVGVPALLAHWMGNPLPRSIDVDAVWRTIERGTVPEAAVFAALAIAAWTVWLLLAVSVVVEVVAVGRGRVAARLVGLGALQPVAARLVATATLVVAGFHARPVAAAPAVVPLTSGPVVEITLDEHAAIDDPAWMPERVGAREYVVERRDTLWSIATRELGDPQRWPEIAALNDGIVQPDGRRFDASGPIFAGWTLRLPADAAASSTPVDLVPAVAGTVTVVRGDTLWDLSETHLGDPWRWPEVFELNRDRPQPDGRALRDPNLIDIGWQLSMPEVAPTPLAPVIPIDRGAPTPPAEPAPTELVPTTVPLETSAPTTTTATGSTSTPEVTAPETSAPASSAAAATSTPAPEVSAVVTTAVPTPPVSQDAGPGLQISPGAITGALGLVAGAVLGLDRLRRRASRRRPARTPVRIPQPLAPEAELTLRAQASAPTVAWLHHAVTAAQSARAGRDGAIVAARLDVAGATVMLDRVDRDPVAAWTQGETGTEWHLPLDTPIVTKGAGPTAPALVSIGIEAGVREVLVDLEAMGWIDLVGPGAATFIDEVAATLVVAPASAGTQLLRADRATGEARGLVVERAVAHAASVEGALAQSGLPSTAAARVAQEADELAPVVVVLDATVDEEARARLRAAVGAGGRGVAVLDVGGSTGPWTLHVHERTAELPRLELHVARPAPDLLALAHETVSFLVEARSDSEAEEERPVENPEAPVELHPRGEVELEIEPEVEVGPARPTETGIEAVEAGSTEAIEVEVRLLGPVEVHGGAEPVDRRSTEFVAFLACHPEGAREDQLKAALWPDQVPAASSWTNRVSKTRKALGMSHAGALHLPHIATGGRYRLGPGVRSDLEALQELLDRSDRQAGLDAIHTLETALALVRGAPFSTAAGYDWAFVLGHVAIAEAAAADAAHRLAELYLEVGDPHGALRAVQRGLIASPCNEVLYRDRMYAHDRLGNPEGVEAAMRDLARALETDDPEYDVHPETWRVYESLRRARSRPAI